MEYAKSWEFFNGLLGEQVVLPRQTFEMRLGRGHAFRQEFNECPLEDGNIKPGRKGSQHSRIKGRRTFKTGYGSDNILLAGSGIEYGVTSPNGNLRTLL